MSQNSPEKSVLDKLEGLDKVFTKIINLFEASQNIPVSQNNLSSHGNYLHLIDLEQEISEIDNYEAALEALNQAASELGYSFKKGQCKTKGNEVVAKSVVCKYYNRNKEKYPNAPISNKNKNLVKEINCTAFYRFRVNSDGTVSLTTFAQEHNHQPINNTRIELTPSMKKEIAKYHKYSNVTEIKASLENSFSCKLDYWVVYREFRKQFPRLGASDCYKFLDFIRKNECLYEDDINEDDQSLCKLLFLTPKMLRNYKKFHDILLIDTTYNTNFYSIPLVVLSGIDNNFKNIVFAFALINNESKETYQWVLNSFFKHVGDKCTLVVSDSDNALCSAIKEELKGVPHRLCCWHIARNLKRNFGFLKNELQSIKDKIFSLPYEKKREKFDKKVNEIKEFLKEKKFQKQIEYLDGLLTKKESWAESYFPCVFDGGVATTSRVESWNAFIKRYLNSKSEIFDFVNLIQKIDNMEFHIENEKNSGLLKALEFDPLVSNLKNFLAFRLYCNQIKQYLMAKVYDSEVLEETSESITYSVFFTNNSSLNDENDIEEESYQKHVVKIQDKILCSCAFYTKFGLVCRHVFHICALKNIKNIEKLMISDRWRKSLFHDDFPHFIAPPIYQGSDVREAEQISLIKETVNLEKNQNVVMELQIMSRKNSEDSGMLNVNSPQETNALYKGSSPKSVKKGNYLSKDIKYSSLKVLKKIMLLN